MKIFGWTLAQYEYAKSEHTRIEKTGLPTDADGLLELKRWWAHTARPEPLSIVFEGVTLRDPSGWAAVAITEALSTRRG